MTDKVKIDIESFFLIPDFKSRGQPRTDMVIPNPKSIKRARTKKLSMTFVMKAKKIQDFSPIIKWLSRFISKSTNHVAY